MPADDSKLLRIKRCRSPAVWWLGEGYLQSWTVATGTLQPLVGEGTHLVRVRISRVLPINVDAAGVILTPIDSKFEARLFRIVPFIELDFRPHVATTGLYVVSEIARFIELNYRMNEITQVRYRWDPEL